MKKLSCLFMVATAAISASLVLAQNASRGAEAGKLFRGRCQSCHQPPDLRFPTDRAWLDQINRTA